MATRCLFPQRSSDGPMWYDNDAAPDRAQAMLSPHRCNLPIRNGDGHHDTRRFGSPTERHHMMARVACASGSF